MRRILIALAAGLIFGLGLTVSQMINPAKVIGFLDLAGPWDPSLAFVMLAAIPVAAAGFALARRRTTPLCAANFAGPTKTRLEGRLIAGAVLFGIGWGLVGFCPGPALASLTVGGARPLVFIAAMLVGMAGFGMADRLIAARSRPA
jgi:uncharacterized membrane protein YedE/YeeE